MLANQWIAVPPLDGQIAHSSMEGSLADAWYCWATTTSRLLVESAVTDPTRRELGEEGDVSPAGSPERNVLVGTLLPGHPPRLPLWVTLMTPHYLPVARRRWYAMSTKLICTHPLPPREITPHATSTTNAGGQPYSSWPNACCRIATCLSLHLSGSGSAICTSREGSWLQDGLR